MNYRKKDGGWGVELAKRIRMHINIYKPFIFQSFFIEYAMLKVYIFFIHSKLYSEFLS